MRAALDAGRRGRRPDPADGRGAWMTRRARTRRPKSRTRSGPRRACVHDCGPAADRRAPQFHGREAARRSGGIPEAHDRENQDILLHLLPLTVRMTEGPLSQADPQGSPRSYRPTAALMLTLRRARGDGQGVFLPPGAEVRRLRAVDRKTGIPPGRVGRSVLRTAERVVRAVRGPTRGVRTPQSAASPRPGPRVQDPAEDGPSRRKPHAAPLIIICTTARRQE